MTNYYFLIMCGYLFSLNDFFISSKIQLDGKTLLQSSLRHTSKFIELQRYL